MKNVLFVCVENSCRSQLAEAFGHIHKSNDVAIYSAGSNPSGQVNLKAVVTMAELGYDMGRHQSQSLDEMPAIDYDAVITMGCGDNCPWVKGRIREDWAHSIAKCQRNQRHSNQGRPYEKTHAKKWTNHSRTKYLDHHN